MILNHCYTSYIPKTSYVIKGFFTVSFHYHKLTEEVITVKLRNQMDESAFNQTYFRPSCSPVLNLRVKTSDLFNPYSEKTYDQIQVPATLTRTPEETILNYFSILREADNTIERRSCGTIGYARIPYPLAYNFLSKKYQKKRSYEEYLHLFAGIGHINLIKLARLSNENQDVRFFYEMETIEVFEGNDAEYFGYSYGFIQLTQEQTGYRISDMNRMKEDFLCAPYHGWSHNAEAVVEVKYGNWCKLVNHIYPTIKSGYAKNIPFHGNDGADYYIVFFTLTNGTDVEIAQYRKVGNEGWKQIQIKPEEECLTEKNDS